MSNLKSLSDHTGRGLLLVSIIGISFSLRAPITSIGPLAGLIHEDLGVSNGFIGFMTTLPLIAFSICSPFIPRISSRIGIGRTMLFGLVFIVAGGVIRSYTGIIGLLVGTALIGVGISAANVLIPSIVKLNYPQKIGIITSIYITAMAVFASIGAGASYPLASVGFGWKTASIVWIGIAFLAIFAWYPQRNLGSRTPEGELQAVSTPGDQEQNRINKDKKKNIWKSSLAWYITLFMGFQSLNYYSLTAWIPSILQGSGMTPEMAGYMAFWYQLIGMPFSFITPILASRVKNQRIIVIGGCAGYLLGLIMLMMFHSTAAVVVALLFLANGGTVSFGWSMVMISLKAKDAEEAVKLSGMSQAVGYLLAAIGPALCGAIYDNTESWSIVMGLFLGCTAIMVVTGILAAKREKLFN
ncbi:MAG TPA: MFS transporter [Anaerovoracaceae bacterium]|nr:MFS transporter [Anaerovoracaceae bacterium]